jgi:hypothetical protein
LYGEGAGIEIVGPERGKISGQTRNHHLVETDRLLQVLEMMFPKITQAHALRYVVFDQVAGGL